METSLIQPVSNKSFTRVISVILFIYFTISDNFTCLGTLHIAHRPCHGISIIDLPGFGSDDEKGGAINGQKDKKGSQESSSAESAFQAEEILKSREFDGRKRVDNEEILKSREFDGRKRVDDNDLKSKVPVDDLMAQMKAQLEGTKDKKTEYPPGKSPDPIYRRHWLVSSPVEGTTLGMYQYVDKDDKLKSKISTLVQQTVNDTDNEMKILSKLKGKHNKKPAYKVGFILSMIKKSRDVLNELFNVAIKHRDEWRALEQLKIFELIVHTNVDITRHVRELLETHMKNLGSATKPSRKRANRIGDA